MFNKFKYIVLAALLVVVNVSFAQINTVRNNTEITLGAENVLIKQCYYDDKAYSKGAIILVNTKDKKRQLKCSNVEHFEINGALGWFDLENANELKQPSKINIDRE